MAIVENVGNFVEEHPLWTVGIGLGVVVLIFIASSGGDAQPAVAPNNSNAGYAAAIGQSQIAADAQVKGAQIASNTAIANTAAAAGVATAEIQAQLAAALSYNNAMQSIAHEQFASATTIETTNAKAAVAISNNASLTEQFSTLAAIFGNYAVASSNNDAAQNIAAMRVNESMFNKYVDSYYRTYEAINTQLANAQNVQTTTVWQNTYTEPVAPQQNSWVSWETASQLAANEAAFGGAAASAGAGTITQTQTATNALASGGTITPPTLAQGPLGDPRINGIANSTPLIVSLLEQLRARMGQGVVATVQ